MARDLNRLFEDLRNSREVYVAQDGTVEPASEAAENASAEERREGQAQPRTRLKPEIFGGVPSVAVALSVIAQAHALAHAHPVETGAIGVGPDPYTISELIPSGPSAKRSASSFELDAEYLQPHLDAAEARGLRFTAFWHSHPGSCPRPSAVDEAAARRMLSDKEWGLPGHLYLPISVRTRDGFATRFFVAEGAEARTREVTPVILSRNADDVPLRAAATGTKLMADDCVGSSLGLEARVTQDLAALHTAGWTTSERRYGKGLALRATRADIALWFVLPPEYPVSGPDVFVEVGMRLEQVPVSDTPELLPWSSLRLLPIVAEQAAKSVRDSRAAESLILRPRVVSLIHRLPSFGTWFPSRSAS